MSSRVRAFALAILAALAFATPLAAPPSPAAGATVTPRARSVLIITLPTTTWSDIRGAALPNLTRLFRHSAVADLATRSVRSRTDAGTGYLAFGAGTRSIGNGEAAAANLNPEEQYEQTSAAAVFRLRSGQTLKSGVGALGWPALHGQNDSLSYGAVLGQLGQTLEDAKIGRRVIANADEQGPDAPVLHREAALTLVDTHGRVPGAVSDLLMKDPEAPFGQRLDQAAVMQKFPGDFRTRRQVVAVEASDLARADSYRRLASPAQRRALRKNALRETDNSSAGSSRRSISAATPSW